MVNGVRAAAREVLVQFVDMPAAVAAHQPVLERQIDADRNVGVGRWGLRRLRSRSFDVETLLAFLRAQPGIVFAEPNYVLSATAAPDDPEFPSLWGLLNIGQAIAGVAGTPGADIAASDAWEISTGAPAVAVGVLDSGIDYSHPDLAPNVWSAPSSFSVTIGGSVIHCPAGSHGFNAITDTCDPMDDQGHGTHVSGTIGAKGNNGIGIAGVNWTTSIIAAKMLDSSLGGTIADAIDAIDFMVQTKAAFGGAGANIRVLNNSWGGTAPSVALETAIATAAAHDMLVVAAAGNRNADIDITPFYPASYTLGNVLAVASTTNQDLRSSFSSYGAVSVDAAAPGSDILSTLPGGGYGYLSGTSMATPHVAGAAALVLSVCALDTPALKTALMSTVDPIPALTGLVATGGRLNVNRAVRTCGTSSIPAAPKALAATAGPERVILTWHPAVGATTYNVKRSTTAGGPYDALATGVAPTLYTDTGVVAGQHYYFVVSAVNALGESADSDEASATPLPPKDSSLARPTDLGAVPGDARVALTWNASQSAERYRVKRGVSRSGPYQRIGFTRSTSFLDTSVVNGTKYFYVVTAVSDVGESNESNKVSATPAPIPAAPVGVAVEGTNAGEILLSWTAVDWATTYRVRRSTSSGGPYSGVRKVTATSFTDTGLKSGRRYYYLVTALNDSGESPGIEVTAVAK